MLDILERDERRDQAKPKRAKNFKDLCVCLLWVCLHLSLYPFLIHYKSISFFKLPASKWTLQQHITCVTLLHRQRLTRLGTAHWSVAHTICHFIGAVASMAIEFSSWFSPIPLRLIDEQMWALEFMFMSVGVVRRVRLMCPRLISLQSVKNILSRLLLPVCSKLIFPIYYHVRWIFFRFPLDLFFYRVILVIIIMLPQLSIYSIAPTLIHQIHLSSTYKINRLRTEK